MAACPSQEELWRTWLQFLAGYGSVEADPEVGATVYCQGRASHFLLTRADLFLYVRDYVEKRRLAGLSDGLSDGLPSPLTDSFGDCFGPQQADHAEFRLEGLDFMEVVRGTGPSVKVARTADPHSPETSWFGWDQERSGHSE